MGIEYKRISELLDNKGMQKVMCETYNMETEEPVKVVKLYGMD